MDQKLKKQFDEMKAKHPDTVLLFRLGDFYESYEEDAEIVAKELGITLTKKGNTKMAGFPHHSLDNYLPKLVRAGKRVAMCDQLEDPKLTKKLVKRGITEDRSSTSSVEQSTSSVEQSTASQTSNSPTMAEVKNLPTWGIKPSPMNPRKTFDEGAIAELAASIKQHGLLQPITVRPVEGKDAPYEIVMGERRYRAYCLNQQQSTKYSTTIPCIVREMTDEEALDAMITENLQRKDVDPIEEAFAFGQLLKTGKTIEQIADRFGKSKRFIQERIKLDNLLPELKQFVTKEWMTIGAAMHICKLTEEEQRKFFNDFAEDYDIEAIDSDGPITKQEAVEFTNDLFMEIKRAVWDKSFEGSCGTTCEKCPFNNTNAGCLFYEMKPTKANCTNRAKWNAKRFSWLMQTIEDNAAVLVKDGNDLETGKTVVVTDRFGYDDRCDDYQPLLQKIRDMGFKVAGKDEYFERYSSYKEDDERLQEKLANNEVYRVLHVEATLWGTEVHVRYFEFKKNGVEESSEEIEAMNLVNQYKENERKNVSATAAKLRDVLADMEPTELSKEALTQTESLMLMTLILRRCSYKYRNGLNIIATYGSEPKALNYARAHTEDVNQICRDFLRETLSASEVEYDTDLQECQRLLLDEWAKEATEEVVNEMAVKLAKKQSKIEQRLTALGYNTDGTKMDF